jgi:hypothetical protein
MYRTRVARWIVGAAVSGAFALMIAEAAQAFNYSTGDFVGVFAGANELIVDMGPLASLTNGETLTFQTPLGSPQLGASFAALETNAPFSPLGGVGANVTFTTDPSVNPRSFDNKARYITGIGPAQVSVDVGEFGAGWLPQLNLLPPAGMGGVFLNTPVELSISATNVNSWTNLIGPQINDSLPFSTTSTLTANGHVVDLWTGTRTGTTTSQTVELGTLTVDGNVEGGQQVQITFNAVPEPSTFVLIVLGIGGVATIRRRHARSTSIGEP